MLIDVAVALSVHDGKRRFDLDVAFASDAPVVALYGPSGGGKSLTLQAIAGKTGGKYYRADSSETLHAIYDEIDKLEKSEVETKKYVRVEERLHWAVLPGLALLLLEILLSHTAWRKLP